MLRAKVQIEGYASSAWKDTFDEFGLVYLDSDKRVGSDIRPLESISYPETPGEYVLPKTVPAAFDYKIKFFIQADSTDNANKKIKEFNSKLYTTSQGSSVRTYRKVKFRNLYKRHEIVGYPQEIALATDFWRDKSNQVNDVVIVEWTIRVTEPQNCNFNYTE